MSLLANLPSQKKLDGAPALMDALGFRRPTFQSDEKLFLKYGECEKNYQRLSQSFGRILGNVFHLPWDPPPGPEVVHAGRLEGDALYEAMQANLYEATNRMALGLQRAGFGTITWHSDSACTFTYPQTHVRSGWLTKTISHERHTHELVKARQHRLPAKEIGRPAIVNAIVGEIPEFAHPAVRIVAGLEVVKSREVLRTVQEPTELGRFFQSVQPDPALCIGNIVLIGWEN
jgi:hypothetical protein